MEAETGCFAASAKIFKLRGRSYACDTRSTSLTASNLPLFSLTAVRLVSSLLTHNVIAKRPRGIVLVVEAQEFILSRWFDTISTLEYIKTLEMIVQTNFNKMLRLD